MKCGRQVFEWTMAGLPIAVLIVGAIYVLTQIPSFVVTIP